MSKDIELKEDHSSDSYYDEILNLHINEIKEVISKMMNSLVKDEKIDSKNFFDLAVTVFMNIFCNNIAGLIATVIPNENHDELVNIIISKLKPFILEVIQANIKH